MFKFSPGSQAEHFQECTGVVDISVVIPVYNAEPYLVRCIEALESQDYPRDRYEVIMVDNNSTDRSMGIIKRYPSVRLLQEPKQGAYAARNRGITAASGSIIAFTDPDCVPEPDWLRNIAEAMKDPKVGIVMGQKFMDSGSKCLSLLNDYINCRDEYVCNSETKELHYGYTNNMAVRRELLNEISQFVEWRRGGDSVFVSKAVEKYSPDVVRYCPQMRVKHLEVESLWTMYRKFFIYGRSGQRINEASSYRPLTFRERFAVIGSTVRKHKYSPSQSVLLLFLLGVGFVFWYTGSLSGRISRAET